VPIEDDEMGDMSPEGMGPLGRPMHIWEDDIKMNLKRNRIGEYDWIHLVQGMYQSTAKKYEF
jgi:hypothetical protein